VFDAKMGELEQAKREAAAQASELSPEHVEHLTRQIEQRNADAVRAKHKAESEAPQPGLADMLSKFSTKGAPPGARRNPAAPPQTSPDSGEGEAVGAPVTPLTVPQQPSDVTREQLMAARARRAKAAKAVKSKTEADQFNRAAAERHAAKIVKRLEAQGKL
jgi:hypothetical protein